MATKNNQKKPIHHTLREFLFAMSYWGSWTRALLFFVLIALMLALTISDTTVDLTTTSQHVWFTTLSITSVLVYSLSFFVYDAAYVTLARRSPIKHRLDRFALFVAEALAVVSIFSILFVYQGDVDLTSIYVMMFAALLLLPIRAVIGFIGQKN